MVYAPLKHVLPKMNTLTVKVFAKLVILLAILVLKTPLVVQVAQAVLS